MKKHTKKSVKTKEKISKMHGTTIAQLEKSMREFFTRAEHDPALQKFMEYNDRLTYGDEFLS